MSDAHFVIGIDPGPDYVAWVLWDGKEISRCAVDPVCEWRVDSPNPYPSVAVECPESWGRLMSNGVLETCETVGIIRERVAQGYSSPKIIRLTRKEIVVYLCGSRKAKAADVHQALLNRFNGGERPKKGHHLHRLYEAGTGNSDHLWAAFAVAVVAWDKKEKI